MNFQEESYSVRVNGEYKGQYQFDTVYTAIAELEKNGIAFSYWRRHDGIIMSYNASYDFKVCESVAITAVYKGKVAPTPLITTANLVGITLTGTEAANRKLSFSSRYQLPEGYTKVECGHLICSKNINFVIGEPPTGVTKAKSNMQTDRGEYMSSLSGVKPNAVRYGRGYLIYTDPNGTQNTIYAKIVKGVFPTSQGGTNMALDVKVKIDLQKPAGKAAAWFPLIITADEETAIDYAECKDLEEVAAAGFADTTDVYKAAALMFSQKNPPAKIAVAGLTATSELGDLLSEGWRQIILVGTDTSQTNAKAIATAIAATKDKMFFATVTASTAVSSIKTVGGERTVVFVHSSNIAVAALVGEAAGRDVGSFTYKNLILTGITPDVLTDSEIEAIHTAGGITFVTKAGDNVTSEGKTVSGEYIDIIDSEDYVIQQLEYQTQKTLNNMDKVPYDNNGIAVLESVAVNVMKDAYNKGMIATNDDGSPAYSVDYAMREQTEPEDRAARKYLGGKFSFALAGAIHTVEITGEIIV